MNSCQPRLSSDRAGNECDPISVGPPDFGLEVTTDRERVIVRVSGEVDLATADALETGIIYRLERRGARIVVDLRAVSFIDSSGIRALIAADQRARELQASVSFIIGDGQTRRVLELTGLIDCLQTESTPDGKRASAAPTSPPGSVEDSTV